LSDEIASKNTKQAGVTKSMKGSDEKSPIAQQIDDNLRKVYTSALEENVPDRFLRLLAELRERENNA